MRLVGGAGAGDRMELYGAIPRAVPLFALLPVGQRFLLPMRLSSCRKTNDKVMVSIK